MSSDAPKVIQSDTSATAELPAFAKIRLQLIALLNRWLSPDPPPFYGWPDDNK